jgi:hypothetical protein
VEGAVVRPERVAAGRDLAEEPLTGEPLIEVAVPARLKEVWAHLRDPALIRRWFGWDHDQHGGLSREIELIFLESASVDEGARTVEWDHGPEHRDRFELRAEGEATVLRVMRRAPDGDGAYDEIAEGWITFVQQLRFALARHTGEERRTLHLSAPASDPEALPIAATLGLGAAAAAPVGGRYEATAGPGQALGGEVWFRTPNQLGLTLDQLGDGLLVVTETPAAAKPPHGAAALTFSAYGPAAARLDELSAPWQAWWEEHIGRPTAA